MLTMDQIHDIRNRFYEKGENISQIAEALHLDWRTVRKYIDQTDFNSPPPKPALAKQFCPKLDPYKEVIDSWLIEDKSAPRKQRHTAKRVFHRLLAEIPGFDCSYRTVASYYAVKHREIFKQNKQAYLPLVHQPGEAQVDFGTAVFYENGQKLTGKYLEVSFPYSNKGYLQLFYGENMECLLEGLDAIFRHIGCVPRELWFDNTKVIVTEIIRGGGRKLTDKFERFREHYHFKAVFMNPGAGHEKGNVENKVGYQRRNFMVPVPRFLSLSDYNRQLLTECEKDARRNHYRYDDIVFGTRPEAIKMCPLVNELKSRKNIETIVCVTGQHRQMLDQVLDVFGVSPDYDLSIMKEKQSLFDVTSNILNKIKEVLEDAKPDVVLVHGDTSTTFVTALSCFYLQIPVGHVEAGLRTNNLYSPFPEEFNRQAVSIISKYNFAPTETSKQNLLREGKSKDTIFVTGNTAIG